MVALLGGCTAGTPTSREVSVEAVPAPPPTLREAERPSDSAHAPEPEPELESAPPCVLADASTEFPSPLYENLFRTGARFEFGGEIIEEEDEEDDYGLTMTCKVDEVVTSDAALVAQVRCDAVDASASRSPADVPREVSPDGVYVATAAGLFRTASVPSESEIAALSLAELVMLPNGGDCVVRDDRRGKVATIQAQGNTEFCSNVTAGEGLAMSLCFRRGAGVVDGEYHLQAANRLFRGYYELRTLDLPRTKRSKRAPELVLNEVVPAGAPYDWIEVVNVSNHALQLDDFVYVDRTIGGEFDGSARVIAFPTLTLAPGAYHVQIVSRDTNGFALSSGQGELVAIHRADDLSAVDSFEWPACEELGVGEGQCILARSPNLSGAFVPTKTPTPGHANPRK